MLTVHRTKARNSREGEARLLKERVLGEATNEFVIAVVGILSTIATAFVAARKSADNANRIAQQTLAEVTLLRENLTNKSNRDNERYQRIEKELDEQSRKMETMRTDIDMMRGALGTRKEDHRGNASTF